MRGSSGTLTSPESLAVILFLLPLFPGHEKSRHFHVHPDALGPEHQAPDLKTKPETGSTRPSDPTCP